MFENQIFITSTNHDPHERVKFIIAADPTGLRQFQKCSEYATRAVHNTDTVARAVFFPHMGTQEPTPNLNDAIFDDAFNKGGSTQNIINPSEQICEIHEKNERTANDRRTGADGRPPQTDRQYMGLVYMNVGELRNIRNGFSFPVGVYDSGTVATDPHHADIIVNSDNMTKRERKEIRVRLLTIAHRNGLDQSPALSEEHISRISHIKKYVTHNG